MTKWWQYLSGLGSVLSISAAVVLAIGSLNIGSGVDLLNGGKLLQSPPNPTEMIHIAIWAVGVGFLGVILAGIALTDFDIPPPEKVS